MSDDKLEGTGPELDSDDPLDVAAILTQAFEAIAWDQNVALEVIGNISFLAQPRNADDPKDIENCRAILQGLVEVVMEAMVDREFDQANADNADIAAVHELGRYMLGEIDKSGEDEGLYVLISGIAGLIADYFAEYGELNWTFGTNDKVLIDMRIADGDAPNLTHGALDRARSAMRDAGWLTWQVSGDDFVYTLTPPDNWRELVRANEVAIATAERDAHGGPLQ
jgi:hypothetical protein